MSMNKLISANETAEKIRKAELDLNIMKDKLSKELEEDEFIRCENCGVVLDSHYLSEGLYTVLTVDTDCGYGDDDEIADVRWAILVKRCPKCGAEISRRKEKLSETNRRARNQNSSV